MLHWPVAQLFANEEGVVQPLADHLQRSRLMLFDSTQFDTTHFDSDLVDLFFCSA